MPAVLDDILREIKFGYLPVGPQFPDHTRDGTSQIGAEKIREGDSGGVGQFLPDTLATRGIKSINIALYQFRISSIPSELGIPRGGF